jgi:YbgC/YbaW family acyl-CoA thioester hydrolase
MVYEFQVTRRVEFSDTDLAGIMHFSNFFRFMETAEHAFFRSLGHSVVLARSGLKLCLPRVHASCDYRAPLFFEDEVLVRLLVQKKSARSLAYQFRFYRLNGTPETEVARGKVVVVCAERQPDGSMRAAPLPDVIARKIRAAPRRLLAEGLPPTKPKTGSRAHAADRNRPKRPGRVSRRPNP